MPSAAELARARTEAQKLLPETGVILFQTVVSNAGGGGSATFAPRSGGTVACRIAPLRGGEPELGDRISEETDWIVTLPALTTIAPDDRIAITGAGTFSVMALRGPRSYEITRRVEARKLA
jgi:hypothetical protein